MDPSVPKSDHVSSPCVSCSAGDHKHHQPALGGICIGCICDWRPPVRVPSVLSDLAAILAPLVEDPYDGGALRLDWVRFVGSSTDLLAYATNGKVLGVVTVLGDFASVGDVMLPGPVARQLGAREWRGETWPGAEGLTAEAHLQPGDDKLALPISEFNRVMPQSRAPSAITDWFLNRPLRCLAEVLRRIVSRVQLSGVPLTNNAGETMCALRVDSRPRLRTDDGGELMWASFVVLPARELGSEAVEGDRE